MLLHFSLVQSVCSWEIVTSSAHVMFFSIGTLQKLPADILASHRRLLITVFIGNFRSSLITSMLIISWVFSILAVLPSIWMVVFHILPGLSGFGWHFKAFEMFLAHHFLLHYHQRVQHLLSLTPVFSKNEWPHWLKCTLLLLFIYLFIFIIFEQPKIHFFHHFLYTLTNLINFSWCFYLEYIEQCSQCICMYGNKS